MRDALALRIIDANLNRTEEGLRVCEEIVRFVFNNKSSAKNLKSLRHKVIASFQNSRLNFSLLINARDVAMDVGKDLPSSKRHSVFNIFSANAQRVKESLRVLEEFLKLFDDKASNKIQKIRFQFYTIEKKIIQRFPALPHLR